MYWDVKSVKPLPGYRIYVEIEDGRRGIFGMKPYLGQGVFRELQDIYSAPFQVVKFLNPRKF